MQALDAKVGLSHFGKGIVHIVKGGHDSLLMGTWLHEKLALKFAAWLSPEFELWVYDCVHELLTTGSTSLNNLSTLDILEMATVAEKRRLAAEAELQEAQPKVEYCEKVLDSNKAYRIGEIAKELGMSARTLNQKLNELRIQYKVGSTWVLYADYQDKDYTKTKTHTGDNSDGTIWSNMQTRWTEKGRRFIHSLLNKGLEQQQLVFS